MSEIESATKVVDEYHISITEKDSFKAVVVKFKCSDGTVANFEFLPLFAHRFSDETCIAAIRALAK